MESACIYGQKTVMNELTQGIEMAKQLRLNLNSTEARQFFIQKILSSYENALFGLKSGEFSGQPLETSLRASSLLESSTSTQSPQFGEFEFDKPHIYQQNQNAVSKKRKGTAIFETTQIEKRTCNKGVKCSAPQPPPSPENPKINPTHRYQPSPSFSLEMLSNLRANLTVNTSDFIATAPSSCSYRSTPLGFMEDDHQQVHFPNEFDDEFLEVLSPPFFSSPVTSVSNDSNCSTEWGSFPSYDFLADADVFPDFLFDNSLF